MTGRQHVGHQPGVNAAEVEAMPTPRQHAHLLAVHELAEAYGAYVVDVLLGAVRRG